MDSYYKNKQSSLYNGKPLTWKDGGDIVTASWVHIVLIHFPGGSATSSWWMRLLYIISVHSLHVLVLGGNEYNPGMNIR